MFDNLGINMLSIVGHAATPSILYLNRVHGEEGQVELMVDNLGFCRFHRGWAEEMIPDLMDSLFGLRQEYLDNVQMTAGRINSRNASVFWESKRNLDLLFTFLKRKRDIDGVRNPELDQWIAAFETDPGEAGLKFWYEIHMGIQESLSEFEPPAPTSQSPARAKKE